MTIIDYPAPPAPLATCSVRAFRPEMGVPVRTTVGMIRQVRCASITASGLAPYGLLKVDDRRVFAERYLARLEVNAEKIDGQLRALADAHPGQVLVLLCFEDVHDGSSWCHRTIAAEWLSARYGGCEIPELSPRHGVG